MTELFEQALGEFNAHMGTAYTSEAIELVPITRRNGVRKKNAVIERLHARNKPVSSPSAFSYMFGEAIIGTVVTIGGSTTPPQKFLHTICCNSCGNILSKSYSGTESFVRCPKCQAELYYTVSIEYQRRQLLRVKTKSGRPESHDPSLPLLAYSASFAQGI